MSGQRVALVTGAASGIGKATVHQLVKQGWIVGALDLDLRVVEEATTGFGGIVVPLAASVADHEGLKQVIDRFVTQIDAMRLDLLVNCAGLLHTGNFEDHSPSHMALLLSVNTLGVAYCCQAAFPWLARSARSGGRPAVVNLSSASAAVGIPSMAVYSASKFWVKGFTEALAIEWLRFGIAVRDVMPPFVRTPMLEGRKENRFIKVLGVGLSAEDVAKAVLQAVVGGPLHRRLTLTFKVACALVWICPGILVRTVLARIGDYSTRYTKC